MIVCVCVCIVYLLHAFMYMWQKPVCLMNG